MRTATSTMNIINTRTTFLGTAVSRTRTLIRTSRSLTAIPITPTCIIGIDTVAEARAVMAGRIFRGLSAVHVGAAYLVDGGQGRVLATERDHGRRLTPVAIRRAQTLAGHAPFI